MVSRCDIVHFCFWSFAMMTTGRSCPVPMILGMAIKACSVPKDFWSSGFIDLQRMRKAPQAASSLQGICGHLSHGT